MKLGFPLLLSASLLAAMPVFAQQSYSGVGPGSVPAETVAKFSPPSLSPEVSRRIQTMLDVRSPGLGILSPDANGSSSDGALRTPLRSGGSMVPARFPFR